MTSANFKQYPFDRVSRGDKIKNCKYGKNCHRFLDAAKGKPQKGCDFAHSVDGKNQVTVSSTVGNIPCRYEKNGGKCADNGCLYKHEHTARAARAARAARDAETDRVDREREKARAARDAETDRADRERAEIFAASYNQKNLDNFYNQHTPVDLPKWGGADSESEKCDPSLLAGIFYRAAIADSFTAHDQKMEETRTKINRSGEKPKDMEQCVFGANCRIPFQSCRHLHAPWHSRENCRDKKCKDHMLG
jgi:hypothetical protein